MSSLIIQDVFEPYYAGREGETQHEPDDRVAAESDEAVSRRITKPEQRRRALEKPLRPI